MTGTISKHDTDAYDASLKRAQANFAFLMTHVANLYCMGDSSSIPMHEAQELATSVAYVLGITDATPEEIARVLDVEDPIDLWHDRIAALDNRVDDVLALWKEVVATMPPIRNVSLRDTLVNLGRLRQQYDTVFAAHIVPCDIDYQLSKPVDPNLMGIDFVEAWLSQLLVETRWLAQFETASCVSVLERVCPDYRGLHVNLYDLLLPHESELAQLPHLGLQIAG